MSKGKHHSGNCVAQTTLIVYSVNMNVCADIRGESEPKIKTERKLERCKMPEYLCFIPSLPRCLSNVFPYSLVAALLFRSLKRGQTVVVVGVVFVSSVSFPFFRFSFVVTIASNTSLTSIAR